jgi:methionyl-tRNA formyltransferase
MLNSEWKPAAEGYQCLTGNVQLASIWISLAKRFEDPRFLNAALKAIDVVRRTQVIDSPHGELNGAVAGSFPVWGDYISLAFPNWAAKFFIDAVLEAKDAVAELAAKPLHKEPTLPIALPRSEVVEALAATDSPLGKRPLKIVLLSAPGSLKGHDVARALLARGVKPDAVILDAWKDGFEPLKKKVVARLLDHGPGFFLQKAAGRFSRSKSVVQVEPAAPPPAPRTIEAVARDHGIPTATVLGVNGKAGRGLIKAMKPDILIMAGAGIVGHKLLKIPTIGTLNAHMGILPFFRGMNVAEWSVLHGAPVGATVHFVDRGIDTGRIVAVRELGGDGIGSLDDLRRRIDEAQLELLAQAVLALVNGHDLPTYAQKADEGRQFFVMHPALKELTEARLREVSRRTGTAA